ncbi:uncharacterized protein LTR77_008015 [Saxophila tyrrhenica]|uniref:O-methyltransferase C-terminal domain-containing protein n=1 Tax=Saxophila tyrrhenica TaxID=1690608 RepID=A0AAV9P217_9PEZI|nr:hypothetical protein LTR77_008015 [Saxophila tyrrhenica]
MANRLTTLASSINDRVGKLSAYLSQNNLPCPSFDAEAASHAPLGGEAEAIALELQDLGLELHDLLRGPIGLVLNHHLPPIPIYDMILRFGIASKVPLEGDISFADLSKSTGIDQDVLTRLLHYGILHRIFQEKRPGYISHSVLSKLMRDDQGMQNLVGMIQEDIVQPWRFIADALQKWPGAEDMDQVALLLAEKRTSTTFWNILAERPERAERFAKTMSAFSVDEDIGADYPFEQLGAGTLVESGGSTGGVAFKIAERHKDLKIIVQDLDEIVKTAKEREGCNVSFMTHDFFKEQPVKGADAYMMRWVLHDWSDTHAARILQALVPVLKAGTKILIVDAVVPPFGAVPETSQRHLLKFDISMFALFNAGERTLDQWKALFARADERFQLQRVWPLRNSQLSLLELVWSP